VRRIWCRFSVAKSADFEITHIVDENYPFPGSQHPAAVTRELSGDETGIARMRRGQAGVPFNFIVINTGLKLILIAPASDPGLPRGLLACDMAAAGIDPKAIDTVVLSHFHPDHVNDIMADGRLAFPNTDVKVPAQDWVFWMDDDKANNMRKNRFARERKILKTIADRITQYHWGSEVVPGITALDITGQVLSNLAGPLHLTLRSEITVRCPHRSVVFVHAERESNTTKPEVGLPDGFAIA